MNLNNNDEEEMLRKLINEREILSYYNDEFPRLIDSIDIYELVEKLKQDRCIVTKGDDNEKDVNFSLS